jgi:hypothetical protein
MHAPATVLTGVCVLIDDFRRGAAIARPNVRRRQSAIGFTTPHTAGKSFMFVTVFDPSQSAPRG